MNLAMLIEVKWKDLSINDARGILRDLDRKKQFFNREYDTFELMLIARSIKSKAELVDEKFPVTDLEDIK